MKKTGEWGHRNLIHHSSVPIPLSIRLGKREVPPCPTTPKTFFFSRFPLRPTQEPTQARSRRRQSSPRSVPSLMSERRAAQPSERENSRFPLRRAKEPAQALLTLERRVPHLRYSSEPFNTSGRRGAASKSVQPIASVEFGVFRGHSFSFKVQKLPTLPPPSALFCDAPQEYRVPPCVRFEVGRCHPDHKPCLIPPSSRLLFDLRLP
jgi:hypothetical protein